MRVGGSRDKPRPSIWALRPGDLPSERAMRREPRLRGMENNAAFRLCVPRWRRGGLTSTWGAIRYAMRLRRSINKIVRDWWLAGLSPSEVVHGLWGASPFPHYVGGGIYAMTLTYIVIGSGLMFVPGGRLIGVLMVTCSHYGVACLASLWGMRLFEPWPALDMLKANHPLRLQGRPLSISNQSREFRIFRCATFWIFGVVSWLGVTPCPLYVTRNWIVGADRLDWGRYALALLGSLGIGLFLGLLSGLLAWRQRERNYRRALGIVEEAYRDLLELESQTRPGAGR